MLLQNLRAHCLAPGGSGSILKYLEALMRSPGVSGRIACCFRTDLHFPDVPRPVRLLHQQKMFPSRRNGSVSVDALRQGRQRHPSGG